MLSLTATDSIRLMHDSVICVTVTILILSVRNSQEIVLVLLRLIDTIQQSLCVNLTNNFVKLLPTSSNIYSSKVLIKLSPVLPRWWLPGSHLPELCNDIITIVHVLSLTLTRPNYKIGPFWLHISEKESKSRSNLPRCSLWGSELNTWDLSAKPGPELLGAVKVSNAPLPSAPAR